MQRDPLYHRAFQELENIRRMLYPETEEEEIRLDHQHIIGQPRRDANQNLAELLDDNFDNNFRLEHLGHGEELRD